MEYQAISKNIKMSPRKMRLVVDGVKKNNLNRALTLLSLMPQRAAVPLKKVIDSAVANALNNFKADRAMLSIKDIIVTEGTSMKRFHFASRGRVRPYKRRTTHVTVILSDNVKQESRSTSSGQARIMKQEESQPEAKETVGKGKK